MASGFTKYIKFPWISDMNLIIGIIIYQYLNVLWSDIAIVSYFGNGIEEFAKFCYCFGFTYPRSQHEYSTFRTIVCWCTTMLDGFKLWSKSISLIE